MTRARAEALLHVFDIGARDVEEAIREGIDMADDASEMDALRARDLVLGQARDAAEILRDRYVQVPSRVKSDPLF